MDGVPQSVTLSRCPIKMFSVSLLFISSIILFLLLIFKEHSKKPDKFPPGPPKLPLWLGYWLLLKENFYYPHKAMVKMCDKFNTKLCGFYMGNASFVTSYDYDVVKEMLNREEFSARSENVIVKNRGMGKLIGIFFMNGLGWKDQRWFSLRYMRDFGFGRRDADMEQTVLDEIRYLINFFTSKPKEEDGDCCSEMGIVKMPDTVYGPLVNCIQHTLSSRHFEDYRELRNIGRTATNFLKCIDTTGNAICITQWLRFFGRDYFGWNSSFRDLAVTTKFAKKIIEDRKQIHTPDVTDNFIDVYLNEMAYLKEHGSIDRTSFSEEQLIYTIADYTFPAPVGIGHTMNIIFAHLINNARLQVKVHEEIDRVVGRSRFPTLDDRKSMPYTEALLREGIRKDPIVPLCLSRRATCDTYLCGYFIPKDTILFPNIWGTHNDPKIWTDPQNFRPERFLDENGNLLKADFTLGFGAGKRLCAGETFARNTLFLFVAGILQNFTLQMAPGHKKPDLNTFINGITVIMPSYEMKVIPRP